jgi:hypothetical protein
MTVPPFVRHSFQGIEDSVGAGIDGDRRAIAPEDHAVSVHDEQGTFTNAFALAIGPIRLCGCALGVEVGEQREMKTAVLGEGLMTPGPVHRNAEELGAVLAELRQDFVVQRHLIAADRAPICGIESQDHRPTLQIAERQPLVGGDTELEIRSDRSGG